MKTSKDHVLALAKKNKYLLASELRDRSIPSVLLTRLVRQGKLERIGRGVYVLPGAASDTRDSMALVAERMPQGIICLLSALRYHGIGTQSPWEVWVALPNKAWRANLEYPPLRVIRFSGKGLTEGIEERRIDGVKVLITSPARTVVDCFKFRNKIGLDVALEALQDSLNRKRVSVDDLVKLATALRVMEVMRPYLESLA